MPKVKPLKINLRELFGGKVPRDEEFKLRVGQEIIDGLVANARAGRDKSGNKWTGRAARYSKTYKTSDDFQIFGKSNKVDMTLSGDMLRSINIVKQTPETIEIGFDDPEEEAKAHGHITGNVGVKRDFFPRGTDPMPRGLSEKVKQKFKEDVKTFREFGEAKEKQNQKVLALIAKLSRDIISGE